MEMPDGSQQRYPGAGRNGQTEVTGEGVAASEAKAGSLNTKQGEVGGAGAGSPSGSFQRTTKEGGFVDAKNKTLTSLGRTGDMD